jgi:hypothetical protein
LKSASGNVSTWTLFFLAILGIGLTLGIEHSKKMIRVPFSEENIVKSQKNQRPPHDVKDGDLVCIRKYDVTLSIIFLIFYLLIILTVTRVDMKYYLFHRKGVTRDEKN